MRILEGSYTSSSASTIAAEAVADRWKVTSKDDLEDDRSSRSSFEVIRGGEVPDMTTHPAFSAEVVAWLEASRIYRRADNPHIRGSVVLDDQSAKLSVLSGISLSDISNISVLALPISTAEIQYSHHYRIKQSYPIPACGRRRLSLGRDTHRNPDELAERSQFQYSPSSLGTQAPGVSFRGTPTAGPGRTPEQLSCHEVDSAHRQVKIGLVTTKAAVSDLIRLGWWWPELSAPGVGATWRDRFANMKPESILEFPAIYHVASVFEFNGIASLFPRLEKGWPYLTYNAGEVNEHDSYTDVAQLTGGRFLMYMVKKAKYGLLQTRMTQRASLVGYGTNTS